MDRLAEYLQLLEARRVDVVLLSGATSLKAVELEMLQRWCAAPGPAMVVGDLNASADHSAFRAGTAGCTDAGSATGGSLVGTWNTAVPRWLGTQIDHVLTRTAPDGSGPRPRSLDVLDLPGSDHRALLVRLTLPGHGGYTPRP